MFIVSCGETGYRPRCFECAWCEQDVWPAGGRQGLRLAGGEKDWGDYLDVILDPDQQHGEVMSVNTKSAALYEGDPAHGPLCHQPRCLLRKLTMPCMTCSLQPRHAGHLPLAGKQKFQLAGSVDSRQR
jgi:hypothetical protein